MKVNFKEAVLPHMIAVFVFFIITVLFFSPIYLDNKSINQEDINQWEGGAQELIEYRENTGDEGLWTNSMFGGMPGYVVSVVWQDQILVGFKKLMSFWIVNPTRNILASFICFYILLLAFKVRPYLAIGGALAFGLSSYMIIGLAAGHTARIGAIAFMPLVLAGIHLVFSNKKVIGFVLSTLAVALQLRENHVQMTYYLILMIAIYGLVQLVYYVKQKKLKEFGVATGILLVSAIIALGTSFGKLWALYEFGKYSQRGKSELTSVLTEKDNADGLAKDYAFKYSNGILEPMVLMIPNYYGGSSAHLLVQDEDSKVLKALQQSRDPQTANQLARYTSAYWGNQPFTSPYYAGAVICFLFVIGIAFADKKYTCWLVASALLGIILSWGDSFKVINYLLFDYLPGYNKFRSVTFTMILPLIAMPLLGLIGLENLLEKGLNKETQKKLLISLGIVAGSCLLAIVFAGMASFTKNGENQLPIWFLKALRDDRKSLFRSDALRSLIFILIGFVVLFAHLKNKLSVTLFSFILSALILVDLWNVDTRYFTEANYRRSRDNSFFNATEADKKIQGDKSIYRVYNPQGTFMDARTSYYHQSLGGYSGARLRRYEELFNNCIQSETTEMIKSLQAGNRDISNYNVLNMLNTKYLILGESENAVLENKGALGNAWFVSDLVKVNSADEELEKTCGSNLGSTAIVDVNQDDFSNISLADRGATILLESYKPNELKYRSKSSKAGLALFSEIYYPKGWHAFIDGEEVNIYRANYVLRALQVPQGAHQIVFKFEPKAYTVGGTIMFVSCILLLIIVVGGIGWTIKKEIA